MSRNVFRLIMLSLFFLLFASHASFAQVTTADIRGHVADPSGLTVSAAKITVTNKDTALLRETTSSETGDFAVNLLPPGVYKLTVAKTGFATSVYDHIELVVGQAVSLDVSLTIGSSSAIVEVTGEAPLLDSSSSQIQGSIAPIEVSNLPVADRNFAGLMILIPGVRPADNFDPTKTRSGNVTVNGTDGRAIDYNVDGGDNKDNVIGGIVQNYTMEGIQEFNVVTDRYSADSGRAVGAVVNVISKSGTNNYHGSLFGLFQNSGLNSKPFTVGSGPNPLFHRYQYGGSIGGPIKKDKLFFFGAFEQKREPGSINVDPTAFTELQVLAAANATLASPVSQLPFPYIDDLVTVKADWKISDNQSVSARYGREKWTNPNDQLGNPFVTDLSQSNSDINQFHSLVLSHNLIASPTKINTFAVQFQDFFNGILPAPSRSFSLPTEAGGTAVNPEICFKPNPGCGGGAPEVEVGQNVNVPQATLIRKYQFRDDYNWIRGAHNMRFGANYIYLAKLGGFFFFGANGYQVTFWDNPSFILNPVNAAIYPQGLATPGAVQELTFNTGSGSTDQPPAHSVGLYYQDDYKVSRHLTLNLGLRWDANPKFLVPQLTNDPNTTNRAIAALLQVQNAGITDPVAATGLARVKELVGNASLLRRNTASWKEFQPRIGFAWDPRGGGKFVVRGGFGIARDQIFQNLTLFAIQQGNPTLYQTVLDLTTNKPGTGCTPTPGGTPTTDLCRFSFGNTPLPSPAVSPSQLTAGATGRIIDPRLDDPWSEQASIGAAWQLSNDYAFSADYYHVLGTHEPRVLQMNPKLSSLCTPVPPPAPKNTPAYPGGNPADPRCDRGTSSRLLDIAFMDAGLPAGRLGELRDYSTNTRSLYDGINLALKKRFSRNFTFQASDVISWSRGWGGLPTSSYGGSSLNITPEREFLPGEFGPTNFDERNRFTASGVFLLPYGFEVAPSFQASSGRPYTGKAGSDLDGDGRSTLDRACADGTNTLGCKELPVNSFRGKSFIELDLRTAYAFKIRENMNFRLIWEMYNIGNRNNSCNNVDNNFYGGSFGKPQGYCGGKGFGATFGNAYRSQFGFRFEF